jgi:hypothetical protein
MALKTNARSILEIGPGDHMVTDFLRRKGLEVETMDNDPNLHPDYPRDIKRPWNLGKRFEAILAAEVLEHVPFRYLDAIAAQAAEHLTAGGCFLVSVPYSTIRLFPKDKRYGAFHSPRGRLPTGIPFSSVQGLITLVRGIYRFAILRYTWKGSFRPFRLNPPADENDTTVHHWDAGYRPTDRKALREIFRKHFDVLEEKEYCPLNAIYFVMRRKDTERAAAPPTA